MRSFRSAIAWRTETKLPQIIEDLRDAAHWLVAEGPGLFDVDTSRLAIAGDSAGGYLTLMSGFCVQPRPTVLVALWGYGDITADWYTRPSKFYRRNYPLVSKEDAWRGVGSAPLTSRAFEDRGSRSFYLYCRQQGLWTNNVTGFDPATQDAALTPYCPAQNVTKEYPPTLMVHGTDDTDVPYEQSVQMDRELTARESNIGSSRYPTPVTIFLAAIPSKSPLPTTPRWRLSSGTCEQAETLLRPCGCWASTHRDCWMNRRPNVWGVTPFRAV